MEDIGKINMAAEKTTPQSRLNYSGEISPIVDRLSSAYGVGKPTKFSVIETGYEDCNVIVEASDNKYVAKIFSKDRNPEDIVRYSEIMEKIVEAGVNHPPLIKTSDGKVVYSDAQANGISMVLMKFIDGKTFLQMNRAPDAMERLAVIEQAAKINIIDYHPSYLFDSWAIPNIKVMFDSVKKFIQPEDLMLIEKAMAQHAQIPIENLPHCFVHGDFTKANVLKGKDGKMYILDFSVANWYPRIQELAVIAANLLHDKNDLLSLRDKIELVLNEYNKFNPLDAEEKQHLYAYSLAGAAMEFMGAHQEKFINGNATEETEYWLNLGRDTLKREFAVK